MHTPHISNFLLAKYQFKLEATSVIILPPYAGSTLRGGFSGIFKKNTCRGPHQENCNKCENRKDCTFFQIYENSGEFSTLKLNRFKTPPKPFIFEPPMKSSSQIYEKGQEFFCNMVLVGRAIKEFPAFVKSFKEMGQQGLGKGRGQFVLKTVYGLDLVSNEKKQIYSDATGKLVEAGMSCQLKELLRGNAAPKPNIKRARIEFLTPTRIKSSGSYGNPVNFKVMIQTLLTRISNMAYSYCEQTRILNFRSLVNQAKTVEVVNDDQEWREVRRFQGKKNIEMFLGGYIGEIDYAGEITPFWPWLKAGEVIHLGKNSAFGLGQYSVSVIDES